MLDLTNKNIVLLVMECVRQDHFYKAPAASFMNIMADNGWRFNNAISPYNQTKTTTASLFTGKMASEHLIQSHRDERFDVEDKVLAEIMKEKGYTTVGGTVIFWMHGMFGWNRGFDKYLCIDTPEVNADIPLHVLVEQLQPHLKEPFFLYIHAGDTHEPYKYPKVLKSEFGNDYDASIKFMDMQIRSMVETLPKDTIYIITADHGIGRGEYNGAAWGQGPNAWLYDLAIHVPMLVYGPGIKPRVIDDMFNTKDIFSLITEGKLITDKYAISESYAYHHESCIHKNINEIGRERAMKGYRCILNKDMKLIEGEDGDLHFLDRKNEDKIITWDDVTELAMLKELRKRSKMDLKARRPDIIQNKLKKKMGANNV